MYLVFRSCFLAVAACQDSAAKDYAEKITLVLLLVCTCVYRDGEGVCLIQHTLQTDL